jgi:DNA invertase Pin-like site-specific DNA recombinase
LAYPDPNRELIPVISYARISSDTKRDGHGVDDQHKHNRETAARLGLVVVLELTDNDKSISKADVYREDFETLIKCLATGRTPDGRKARGVIVAEQERLARRFSDWERFTDALTCEPGRVYAQKGSLRDPYSEGFAWEGAAGMVGAKSEPRKISDRTKRSHRSRAQRGKVVGGTRPFGWKADKIELDPVESAIGAKIFRDFIAGTAVHAIARGLREKGTLTTKGNLWTADTVRKYLDNPRACGWRMLNDELVVGGDGNPIVGEWKTFIKPEEWLAAKEKLDARKGNKVTPAGVVLGPLPEDHSAFKYLLTGVLRCGKPKADGTLCLTKLRKSEQRDVKSHLYVCQPKTSGGCAGVGRHGERLDLYVTEAVLAKLEQEQIEAAQPEPWDKEEAWENALKARADLMTAWDNGQGSIPNDTFFNMLLPGVEAKIKELRADRDRYMAAVAAANAMPINIRKEWNENEDISWRRSIIQRAVSAVIVKPAPTRGRGYYSLKESTDIIWRTK